MSPPVARGVTASLAVALGAAALTHTLAAAGWGVAAALAVWALCLHRRLELVARAEHELRGPVTALSLGAEALKGGAGATRAAAIEGQVDRLRIALADLAAARRGRRAPEEPARLPLEPAVAAAAAGWRNVARRAGGDVRLDWRAQTATVRADRGRLAQALGNLLANAVEHGGGHVDVSAARAPGAVRLEVRDGGPGFAARGGRALRRRRRVGRGRGLTIAERAVRDAGGRLTILRGGHGATVAIELPLADGERQPGDGGLPDRPGLPDRRGVPDQPSLPEQLVLPDGRGVPDQASFPDWPGLSA